MQDIQDKPMTDVAIMDKTFSSSSVMSRIFYACTFLRPSVVFPAFSVNPSIAKDPTDNPTIEMYQYIVKLTLHIYGRCTRHTYTFFT